MADLKFTADVAQAIRGLYQLKGAVDTYGATLTKLLQQQKFLTDQELRSKAAFEAKKKAELEASAASLASARLEAAARKRLADSIIRETTAFKERSRVARQLAKDVRSRAINNAPLDSGQLNRLNGFAQRLRDAMEQTGVSVYAVKRAMLELEKGKMPNIVDPEMRTKILPILQSIVALEKQAEASIDRQNKKLTAQAQRLTDIRNKKLAERVGARNARNVGDAIINSVDTSAISAATSKEIAAVNVALGGLTKLNAKAQLTETQLTKLWAEYQAGALKASNAVDASMIAAFKNIEAAINRLGTKNAQVMDKMARDAERSAKRRKKAEEEALNARMTQRFRKQNEAFVNRQVIPGIDPNLMNTAARSEVSSLNKALSQLAQLGAKSQMTYGQMRKLYEDYKAGTIRVMTQTEAAIVATFGRIDSRINNLGAKWRATQEAMAREAAKNARKASLSYDLMDRAGIRALITWQSFVRLLTIQTLHMAFGRLTQAVFDANRQFLELQTQVSLIRTISQDAQLTTEQWTNKIRDLSAAFGMDQLDVARGVYEAISNQVVKGAEAFNFMSEAMLFAKTTGTSTENAVNLLSSAINSYGMSAGNARELAAQFFTVIDLGRVKADDLANTLGRVAPVAATLGVDIAELGAMISTLTRVGIKPNEALTMIGETMRNLVRPTETMEELFRKWGVTNGQMAVQTFGTLGVFQKLQEEALKTGSRLDFLGDAFSRARSIAGTTVLTDPKIMQLHATDIEQITSATGRYGKATEEVMNNVTTTIQKNLEQLRQYISSSISEPLLKFVADFFKNRKSLVQVFVDVKSAIKGVIIGFIALKAITAVFHPKGLLRGIIADIRTIQREQSTATKQIGVMKAAYISLQGALVSLAGIGIGAAISYFVMLQQRAEEFRRSAIQGMIDLYDSMQKERNEDASQQSDTYTRLTRAYRKELDNQYQDYFKFVAGINQLLDKLTEAQTEAFESSTDAFKSSLDEVKDTLRDILRDVETGIKNVKKLGEDAAKNADKIGAKSQQEALSRSLGLAKTPAEKAALIDSRIKELQTTPSLPSFKVTPEGIKDENGLIVSGEDAAKRLEEAAEAARSRMEELNELLNDKFKLFDDDKTKAADQQRLTINQQLTDLTKTRMGFEQQIVKATEEQARLQELLLKQRQGAIQEIQIGLAQLEKIKPDESNPQKALEDFDKAATQVVNQLPSSGLSQDKIFDLTQKMLERRGLLEEMVETQTLRNAAKDAGSRLQTNKDSESELINKRDEAKQKLDQRTAESQKFVSDTLFQFRELKKSGFLNDVLFGGGKTVGSNAELHSQLIQLQQKFGKNLVDGTITPGERVGMTPQVVTDSQGNKQVIDRGINTPANFGINFEEILSLVQQKVDANAANDTLATRQELYDAYKLLETAVKAINEFKTGRGVPLQRGQLPFIPDKDAQEATNNVNAQGKGIVEVVEDMGKQLGALLQTRNEFNALLTQVEADKTNLEKQRGQISQQLADAELRIRELVGQEAVDRQLLIDAIKELTAKITEAINNRPGVPALAKGGRVIGPGTGTSDSILAKLSSGEFVVNADATARHFELLEAINRGERLPTFARGGFVGKPSTVSTIHQDVSLSVTVNGGDTSEQTIREIAHGLRREIRRGSVDLTPRNRK
jgi:TP901 family phage tail tape measure protein